MARNQPSTQPEESSFLNPPTTLFRNEEEEPISQTQQSNISPDPVRQLRSYYNLTGVNFKKQKAAEDKVKEVQRVHEERKANALKRTRSATEASEAASTASCKFFFLCINYFNFCLIANSLYQFLLAVNIGLPDESLSRLINYRVQTFMEQDVINARKNCEFIITNSFNMLGKIPITGSDFDKVKSLKTKEILRIFKEGENSVNLIIILCSIIDLVLCLRKYFKNPRFRFHFEARVY